MGVREDVSSLLLVRRPSIMRCCPETSHGERLRPPGMPLPAALLRQPPLSLASPATWNDRPEGESGGSIGAARDFAADEKELKLLPLMSATTVSREMSSCSLACYRRPREARRMGRLPENGSCYTMSSERLLRRTSIAVHHHAAALFVEKKIEAFHRRRRKERRKNEGPASLTPSHCLLPSITYISYYRREAVAEVPRCRRHPMLRPDASATVKVDKREAENGMEKRKIEECLSCGCFWKERQ
nr:hypothetical protein Iba_chr06bCG12180 [Ipomoea batatas]